jgi:hypothetical protein
MGPMPGYLVEDIMLFFASSRLCAFAFQQFLAAAQMPRLRQCE